MDTTQSANPPPSKRGPSLKEPWCALSHFFGAGLSVIGLIVLLIIAHGRPWHTVAFALYGSSLVLCYLASGISHSIRGSAKLEAWLSRLDYIGIFLLVAGTCMPICLVALRGGWGWTLFGCQVGLAVLGILNVIFGRTPHWIRVILYLFMGWLMVFALHPLRAILPQAALNWVIAGGAIYSVGLIFLSGSASGKIPARYYPHEVWHLFVIAGSACHYYFVLHYIMPLA